MIAMAKQKTVRTYYRTTPKLKGVFSRLMGSLRETETVTSYDGYTSNDAIMNGFILWASQANPEEVAKLLDPHIRRFASLWSEVLDSDKDETTPSPEAKEWLGTTHEETPMQERKNAAGRAPTKDGKEVKPRSRSGKR